MQGIKWLRKVLEGLMRTESELIGESQKPPQRIRPPATILAKVRWLPVKLGSCRNVPSATMCVSITRISLYVSVKLGNKNSIKIALVYKIFSQSINLSYQITSEGQVH